MTAALIYRTLERNTAQVGLQSNSCTTIQPVNEPIAKLEQHQDPASQGAAEKNKGIALELSKQIAAIGGNPLDALKSGTFQPGDLNDSSGKGLTCMFSSIIQKLFVFKGRREILENDLASAGSRID
jgi:hypothetical protein